MAAGEIQSDESIDEQNLTVVNNSALYSRDVDAGTKVGIIVKVLTDEIQDVGEKIHFNDTELVKRTTIRYLRSCERTGAIPSKIGLARACGCDRRSMDKFIQSHPGHATTEFFNIVFDSFAEALSQAALNGSVKEVMSIFLSKALYGMRENEQIAPAPDNPLGEITDTETLMKKYEELTVD